MHPYLEATMQCYAKAVAHLENAVLPGIKDAQTQEGIELLIAHAKQQVEQLQSIREVPDQEQAG